MPYTVTLLSALDKARPGMPVPERAASCRSVLRGERVNYQLYIQAAPAGEVTVEVCSALGQQVQLYVIRDVPMDLPCRGNTETDHGYLTREPGLMPDLLQPLAELGGRITVPRRGRGLWVRADIPSDAAPGLVEITVRLYPAAPEPPVAHTMTLMVLPGDLPPQRLLYTRWMYLDCIAVQHGAELFSAQHWALIERYLAAAADVGINVMLLPVHTPPLDTAEGEARPCVQLVDIEKRGEIYSFSFEKFRRLVALCQKHGICWFEIAHLFTQWGAQHAPNILVKENGTAAYRFGWHTAANDPEYRAFLTQYIGALVRELEALGIRERCFFHISDEPSLASWETYRSASELLRPLLGGSKTLDAVSDPAFFAQGLVDCPVTAINRIHDFLPLQAAHQWVYYCCEPETVYPNCFLAMPLSRVRILGILLYKYQIEGFLQWGFNFYFSWLSRYSVDPRLTTSADLVFPSGDPMLVYPGRDTVYSSIRGQITYEAIQDMDLCLALEAKVGRQAVVELIDGLAGYDVRFDRYPLEGAYLEAIRSQLVQRLGCSGK